MMFINADKIKAVIGDIRKLAFTLALAAITGYLCSKIGLPAPFLLGSLFGVWVGGTLIKPLQKQLGVARWIHIPVVLGIANLIGANFKPEILTSAKLWTTTLIAMIFATVVATMLGLFFLTRLRKYDFYTALLNSVPGGQAEVLLLSRDFVEKDYVVALFHLVRVVIVFCSTPLLLALVEGHKAVADSNAILQAMTSIADLQSQQIIVFVAIAIAGFLIALIIRLPIPHLLGPLFLSSALHIAGFVELPRVKEFVLLAQLIIGGGVGATLARQPFAKLFGYLQDALINACLVIMTYIGIAYAIAAITEINFIKLLLAFVPGGIYEVTLLALIFGYDVAFVAFHHTVRILMIFIAMPLIVMNRKKIDAKK